MRNFLDEPITFREKLLAFQDFVNFNKIADSCLIDSKKVRYESTVLISEKEKLKKLHHITSGILEYLQKNPEQKLHLPSNLPEMIVKGGFDIKDRKLAMKYLPNLTWQGNFDIDRIARVCRLGYKQGLFDPFFEDLNFSTEYEKTPY